jgi:hypothetical protein
MKEGRFDYFREAVMVCRWLNGARGHRTQIARAKSAKGITRHSTLASMYKINTIQGNLPSTVNTFYREENWRRKCM